MYQPNRRRFLATTVGLGAGYWGGTSLRMRASSANDKLNIACIGIGGQGAGNLGRVSGENIVAVCDVDEKRAGKNWTRFPKAKQYRDFRRMLDEMDKSIDAVVVSTPDHTHFHPARQAMLMGKHVYCEKPLAHSAWECRELTRIAKEMKVATQLGNQRHANAGMRRTVEAVQSGMIGKIKEVYAFQGGNRGMPSLPEEFPPVPKHLDWDLWQGPAKVRPYSPAYCPYNWRFWWDFGTGETGNWGCHTLDIPYWALGLSHAERVDLDVVPKASEIDSQRTPRKMQSRLEFASSADGKRPPLSVHWWHGGPRKEVFSKYGAEQKLVLFVGEKGTISADFGGYSARMFDGSDPVVPAESIARSPGFHQEWIEAAKGGQRATCDFVDYSGPLAEGVLLANAAWRSGGGFDWDSKAFKPSGNGRAEEFIHSEFREGWKV